MKTRFENPVLPLQIRPFLWETDLKSITILIIAYTRFNNGKSRRSLRCNATSVRHSRAIFVQLPACFLSARAYPQKHLCVHLEGLLSLSLCFNYIVFLRVYHK